MWKKTTRSCIGCEKNDAQGMGLWGIKFLLMTQSQDYQAIENRAAYENNIQTFTAIMPSQCFQRA